MHYSNLRSLKIHFLEQKCVFKAGAHLCFSIWALLPRELLKDRGQTAEHKDGTVRKRRPALKLQLTRRCNVYKRQKIIHTLQIKCWK